MSWKQWPYQPHSLTDMIGPDSDDGYNQRFISLLVSGCSERLGRPLTVVEPIIDRQGDPIQEPDPDNATQTRLKLERIDQINPHEHFTGFCETLRQLPNQNAACQEWDIEMAHKVMQTASSDPGALQNFSRGYPCRMKLIDQAGIIMYNQTPVAVVFSGQFLPDELEVRQQFSTNIEKLIADYGISELEQRELRAHVSELLDREQYIQEYMEKMKQGDPIRAKSLARHRPTVVQLFNDEIKEIDRIARAQFQMHKRDRESEFRHRLREIFQSSPTGDRTVIAAQTQVILEEIRDFLGVEYLALFISPRRYISFEDSSNMLPLFTCVGLKPTIADKIQHFNWRKARLKPGNQNHATQESVGEASNGTTLPSSVMLTQPTKVREAIRNGLKGRYDDVFDHVTILCQMHLSDAYRAVLLWGPFSHLSSEELMQEVGFLEEISELVIMRVLSAVQLADSEHRTDTWEGIAGLLAHYSRRAMTPVSTGVRIISNYLNSGGIYTKEEALNACRSLETASEVISQAVRAPLFSFAATAEDAYEFQLNALSTIVNDCIALYHPVAAAKGVSFKVDESLVRLPNIEIDAPKMRDAIAYVLDNAIKYSHPNREIRISGEDLGREVRLRIEDYGQGIDADELHLIFGRGYQGKRSKKAIHEEGEGMGLFHARLIVEAHKGKIWGDSRSGSRTATSARLEGYLVWFTIELPVHQFNV